ncbi:putative transcription factor C2H2 family [Helianthus debilis subsp. tardiflorus]
MVYDSIANALIPNVASNAKDFGKKKRVNRTAKLKQSKLDVRREQWLSQVKNKGVGVKEETKVSGGVKRADAEAHAVNERELSMVKLEVSVGKEENEGLMNHYSDSESPSNSPTNFTGSSSRSSSGSSSSSGGCFSRSMTDEDDGDCDDNDKDNDNDNDNDDDCLDDWETMADALAADDIQNNHDDPNQESPVRETAPEPESVLTKGTGQEGHRASNDFRAWRPDDASRPQSLPNLLKQNSFPMQSGSHHGLIFAPSSCPICCEDLDMTDSSFLPCPCGYRLCLFCHKKILEDNGRCPGCRKQYEQTDNKTATFKLTRCYSVNPRR